jgi:hypothetical protein
MWTPAWKAECRLAIGPDYASGGRIVQRAGSVI